MTNSNKFFDAIENIIGRQIKNYEDRNKSLNFYTWGWKEISFDTFTLQADRRTDIKYILKQLKLGIEHQKYHMNRASQKLFTAYFNKRFTLFSKQYLLQGSVHD